MFVDFFEKVRKRLLLKDKWFKFINFVRVGEREKIGSIGEGRGFFGMVGDW